MILDDRKKRIVPVIPWNGFVFPPFQQSLVINIFLEYRQLATLCGIVDIHELDSATQFLHNSGLVLRFAKDDRLSNFLITNPQWLTKVPQY